ncbi:MAG TPA: flavodoxin domain-containing protein [Aestuariivirga sp.]
MKVLIAYATTEGQTRKIAEQIAGQVHELGHGAELVDVDHGRHNFNVNDFNAVIVAASVHQHDHQDAIEVFVAACHAALNTRPTMFLSVSLSAAFDEGRREAQDCITRFIEKTGWTPSISLPVAGALRNEGYDYFQQQILEHVVLKNRKVDHPERDHEFTDWKALADAVTAFVTANTSPLGKEEGVYPASRS